MDLERKRQKIETAVKIVGALVIGFVIAPFIFIAIKGLLGLIAAAIVSLVAINLTPWFSAKLANWRLKAIKNEAAKNPIETMENEYKDKVKMLWRMKDSIRVFYGSVRTFHGKLDGFKRDFPQDSKQFDDQYSAMMQLLELRKAKYEEAKLGLTKFESVINRAKAIWEMAQEAAKMRNAAGADVDAFYSKLKVEYALDSVTSNMNKAFGDLELALMDEKTTPAIENQPVAAIPVSTGPPTLDLNFDEEPERIKA